MHEQANRPLGSDNARIMSHVVRLLALAAVNAAVQLGLPVASLGTPFDRATGLFLDASALYWVWYVSLDLVKHFFAVTANSDGEPLIMASPTPAMTTAALTGAAAVILALTAYVGARLQSARIGGPWLTAVALLIGVVDARAVADGLEDAARTRRVEARRKASATSNP